MGLYLLDTPRVTSVAPARSGSPPAGGGPVGLAFAPALEEQFRGRVTVTVHDGRWATDRFDAADASIYSLDDLLVERMGAIRERLAPRLPGQPTDEALREHFSTLRPDTLRTLLGSGAWDTLIVGGDEADIGLFFQTDTPAVVGVGDVRRHRCGRVRS
ncbi:hypothetical protein [Streptomyces sp. NBC_00878]|uniref:hypothetical protein n=1 Tax=Streptomyces sp. NBC_00878 TaxID=2975854 RepID=UPI002250C5A7|nr:hypothetical protein [Streptomyces sp. NBC_00878]MCX4902846.1 hypothetical protein [Streptomyces sp. NBC_00878]